MTIPPTANETYRKLSDLLQTFAPEDLLLVLDDFEEGLATTLQALQLPEKFAVKVMERDGRVRKRQVADEVLLFTPDAERWFSDKALAARQLHLAQRGTVPVNLERVMAGEENFAALYEARRQFVVQKREDEARAAAGKPASPRKGSSKKADQPADPRADDGRKRGRKPATPTTPAAPAEQPPHEGKVSPAQVTPEA